MIKKINLIAWDREGNHEANVKPIKCSVPPLTTLAWRTEAPCRWEVCRSLVGLFLNVFFKMLTCRLHLEVIVKSSPPYPHSGARFFFSLGEKYRQAAIYLVSENTGRNTGKYWPKFANWSSKLVRNSSKFLKSEHNLWKLEKFVRYW
jgi:hypothetical protein